MTRSEQRRERRARERSQEKTDRLARALLVKDRKRHKPLLAASRISTNATGFLTRFERFLAYLSGPLGAYLYEMDKQSKVAPCEHKTRKNRHS